jgi:tetratricopeptide (TPR) repeat protein
MKRLALRIALLCILFLMVVVAAFGQQNAKDLFTPEANVQNAVTYVDRGVAKQKKGDLDGAIADYNQAIKLNPRYAAAYDNRGNVKRKKDDLDGAVADYSQAIKLSPKYARAYNNLGRAKDMKGDRGGAIADYNQAIELDPHFAAAYNNRGCRAKGRGSGPSHCRQQ